MRSSIKKAYVKGEQTLIANLSVLDKHMNDAVADGLRKFGATWKGGAYALPVHERTEVHHKVGGAKFLEKALNEKSGECAQYLRKILGQVKL